MKAQHGRAPVGWVMEAVGFLGPSCSHRYKTTISDDSLNAVRKYLAVARKQKSQPDKRLALCAPPEGEGQDYCSSDMTIDDIWLVCLSMAVPACISIWFEVIFALSEAKSTSMMRPVAAWVLVLMFDRLL